MTAPTPVQNGTWQIQAHGTASRIDARRTPMELRTVVDNRQARYLYVIEDTYTAGLMLEGWEVKSILAGQANFNGGGAFIRLKDGEAFIDSMTITPLPQALNGLLQALDSHRQRKLLLNRTELNKLTRSVAQKGYTVVPLALTYNGKLKLEIGIAKGKKLADKREAVKRRDDLREQARDIKAL